MPVTVLGSKYGMQIYSSSFQKRVQYRETDM